MAYGIPNANAASAIISPAFLKHTEYMVNLNYVKIYWANDMNTQ
jgi:hypothetical protein